MLNRLLGEGMSIILKLQVQTETVAKATRGTKMPVMRMLTPLKRLRIKLEMQMLK